jgi:hypothetical protein
MQDLERGGGVEEERERGRRRPRASLRARADSRATTLWLGLYRVEHHRHPRACAAPKRRDSIMAVSPLDGAGGGGEGDGSRWRGRSGGGEVRGGGGGGEEPHNKE